VRVGEWNRILETPALTGTGVGRPRRAAHHHGPLGGTGDELTDYGLEELCDDVVSDAALSWHTAVQDAWRPIRTRRMDAESVSDVGGSPWRPPTRRGRRCVPPAGGGPCLIVNVVTSLISPHLGAEADVGATVRIESGTVARSPSASAPPTTGCCASTGSQPSSTIKPAFSSQAARWAPEAFRESGLGRERPGWRRLGPSVHYRRRKAKSPTEERSR